MAKKTVTEKQQKKPTPSDRLNEIGVDAICAHVASGESLLSWAKMNGFVVQTVTDWIDADAERAGKYARAREARADAVFELLDEVSEEAANATDSVKVAGLRLKSDNIKWKLARMAPKKYGDKLQVGGAGDLPPIRQNVSITPEEAYRRMLNGGG